jgi:hypothetical protein
MSGIKRNPNIIWRSSGENTFLFSLETGSLWRLNKTGGRIWELLNNNVSTTDIIKTICNEFLDVNEIQVRKGVKTFISELKKREIIV